jgi:phosphoribosylformylglycinamidine synthase
LDKLQANPECVAQEEMGLTNRTYPPYETTFVAAKTLKSISDARSQYRVAIIRDEGSNGDREMASAFYAAGFEPWDIHMRDMLKGNVNLENFRGIVFVGGFSYADVLDSAKGWAGTVKFNKNIYEQFSKFRNRSDTFSLGICNGCRLMALLGYVPDIPEHNVRFLHNKSERFEARFSTVKVCDSPASKVWFKDMVGSTLGVWVAHGEGRVFFPNDDTLNQVEQSNLVPLRYVDDNGKATETYPFNPNGSVNGITSLCSPNGRHLAMMPHPERCINSWQWPWMPNQLKEKVGPVGPWLKLFQNVRNWCETTNNK